MWQLLFASILLFQQFIPPVVGYGEPDASGHPNYQERANHVFMNAVRLGIFLNIFLNFLIFCFFFLCMLLIYVLSFFSRF